MASRFFVSAVGGVAYRPLGNLLSVKLPENESDYPENERRGYDKDYRNVDFHKELITPPVIFLLFF